LDSKYYWHETTDTAIAAAYSGSSSMADCAFSGVHRGGCRHFPKWAESGVRGWKSPIWVQGQSPSGGLEDFWSKMLLYTF